MPTSTISAGQTSSGLGVSAGETLEVQAGGSALAIVISAGGVEYVSGFDSGTSVSGGSQYVLHGGIASATILSGGVQFIETGGTEISGIVSAGTQEVSSGGRALGVWVSAGAQYVSASGLASGTTVYVGGVQSVLSGGTASATVLSGGSQYLAGVATATAVGAPDAYLASGVSLGNEFVSSGGIASSTVVHVSGTQYVSAHGSAVSASISGGLQTVASGGVAIDTSVAGGSANILESGGNVYDLVSVLGTETVLAGGTAEASTVLSGGEMVVDAGGSASNVGVSAGMLVDSDGTITGAILLGPGGDLVIGGTAMPTAVVSGFVAGTTVDFAKIAPASSGAITLDSANHRIDVVSGGHTLFLELNPNQDLAGRSLLYSPDAGSGTDVSLSCFAEGTLIRTPGGEVPVEALRPGDLVLTLGGAAAPVCWLAVQSVSRRFADPLRVLPVRIRAGALGEGVPHRDLLVSPCHALLIDGLLVNAAVLVDGAAIARVADTPEIYRYYHLELPDHAVIFAEGAATESFLAGAEPFGFDNAAQRATRMRPATELPYPRVKSRRQLPRATAAQLAAQAFALDRKARGAAA